jgi:hypothetical protein
MQLFDHFVGEGEQFVGDLEAERRILLLLRDSKNGVDRWTVLPHTSTQRFMPDM